MGAFDSTRASLEDIGCIFGSNSVPSQKDVAPSDEDGGRCRTNDKGRRSEDEKKCRSRRFEYEYDSNRKGKVGEELGRWVGATGRKGDKTVKSKKKFGMVAKYVKRPTTQFRRKKAQVLN